MKSHFLWAMAIAASVLFGGVLGIYQPSRAGAPSAAEAEDQDQNADLADQVREIKTQVKEINTLLHSGVLKVIVVLNPPSPDAK